MKHVLIITTLLAAAGPAIAQNSQLASRYADVITTTDARKHLTILASDAFEGRETGKPGAEKAAAYLASEFKKIGLQAPVNGSYLQTVPLEESNVTLNFTINGKPQRIGYEVYMPELYTDRTITAAEVVFVGYGTDREIGTTAITGKVVLWINEDQPKEGKPANTALQPSAERGEIIGKLLARQPAAVLAVNRELAGLIDKYRESIMEKPMKLKTPEATPRLPVALFLFTTDTLASRIFEGSGKSYAELLKSAGGENSAITVPARIGISYSAQSRDLQASNVLGVLPGTDLKEEVLVFSAHYDHVGLTGRPGDPVNNGADDDGSGTTGVIEIARAFAQAKKDGHGPRRSILFLANVGEEKGLLGSEFYITNPVFPLRNTIADLNIDMIGRVGYDYDGKADSAGYVYVVGSGMLSTELKTISETANTTYTRFKLDYKYDDPNDPEKIYYRSDHYNFAKNGVPIIFYTDGEHKDYHQASDEVSKINFPLLVKRTQLAFFTGWELANRDKRPVVDGPIK